MDRICKGLKGLVAVLFEREDGRVTAYDGNQEVGKIIYKEKEEVWDAVGCYVEKEYRGQKIADRLLAHLVEWAEEEEKSIYPTCSYVLAKFDRRPEDYQTVDARKNNEQNEQ